MNAGGRFQRAVSLTLMSRHSLLPLWVSLPGLTCGVRCMAKLPDFIGPYRIQKILGKGGMGIVYQAVHTSTERQVALKTLFVPHSGLLQSLRHEIHGLTHLDHPGIVSILDEGVCQGIPWYAMQLIQGQSLRKIIQRRKMNSEDTVPYAIAGNGAGKKLEDTSITGQSETGPIDKTLEKSGADDQTLDILPGSSGQSGSRKARFSVREAVTLLRRLCSPLSYIHGEGVVHRDLKPDNIILNNDGMPVIVDFGLIAHFGSLTNQEELSVWQGALGTASYMAPEQIRGEFVDARADLYAVGCILYELLVGYPPFLGHTVPIVLRAHLYENHRPPSRLRADVPPELDQVIERLLAKKPRERLGYADTVASLLAVCGAENGLSHPSRKPRAYLYRPHFVGRESELHFLRNQIERLKESQGSVIFIGGVSGVGKTRLLMEIAREIQWDEVILLSGKCVDRQSQPFSAMQMFFQTLADRCREQGEEFTDQLLGPRGKILSPFHPSFNDLPGQKKYDSPVAIPPPAAKLRMFNVVVETLTAFTGGERTCFMIDDIQWADRLTLEFIEYLLRAGVFDNNPLLVLCTYRTEECNDVLTRLLDQSGVYTLSINPLEEKDGQDLVQDMLAIQSVSTEFITWLNKQSEGNPLFMAEYVRLLVEEEFLFRDKLGRWQLCKYGDEAPLQKDIDTLPIPHGIRDLLVRRLRGLSGSMENLLNLTAVFGREISYNSLILLSDMDDSAFFDALEVAFRRQLLVKSGPDGILFAHDKLREITYSGLDSGIRSTLHKQIARFIQKQHNEVTGENAAILGHHWEAAGYPQNAAPCYLQGAREATRQYSFSDAEQLYQAFFRMNKHETAERVKVRNEYAHSVLAVQGSLIRTVEEHRQALIDASEISDRFLRGECLLYTASALIEISQLEHVRPYLDEALAVAIEFSDSSLEGRCLAGFAKLYFTMSQYEKSITMYDKALMIAIETGDTECQRKILIDNAKNMVILGKADRAHEQFLTALSMARHIGDKRDEGKIYSSLASLCESRGSRDEAERHFLAALNIARNIGDRLLEAHVTGNFGLFHKKYGNMDRAEELQNKALLIYREIGDRRMEGYVLNSLANIYKQKGEFGPAQSCFQQALALARKTHDLHGEAAVLVDSATLMAQQQNYSPAIQYLRKSIAISETIGDRGLLAIALVNLGIALSEQGVDDEAEERLEQAVSITRELSQMRRLAHILIYSARHSRRFRGNFIKAQTSLQEAVAIHTELGDNHGLILSLCECGFLALAQNQSAMDYVQQANQLMQSFEETKAVILKKTVDHLEQSQQAFDKKNFHLLFRGELVQKQ